MDNVIEVGDGFTPEFRKEIFTSVKYYGIKLTEKAMLEAGYHQSFVKGLLRNIMRKDGW